MKMSETEKAIENLNTAKLILCNQQMLTSEMCIRIGQAVTDAITLLKEQEPRVMTLEEALVDNNNSIEISPYVFVEIKGRNDIFIGSVHDDIYGDYHSNDIKVRVYRIWMSDSKTYPKADYMKTVRFWNRKPTDEQRQAVKWE